MPGSPVDLDILTCGILLKSANDNRATIRAAWMYQYAGRVGIDPGNTDALLAEAERRRNALTRTWRQQCEAVALIEMDTIIDIKVAMRNDR